VSNLLPPDASIAEIEATLEYVWTNYTVNLDSEVLEDK